MGTRGDWETMVERPLRPTGVGVSVTALAGGRKACGRMIRCGRALVLRQMAAHTIARGATVHVVHMAAGAGGLRMTADEREDRGVIELRAAEAGIGRAMTGRAVGREARGGVVGRRRPVVLRPMTGHAVPRRSSKHVIDVTRGTRGLRVTTHEREHRIVIEPGATETGIGRTMARFAGSGESCGRVVRRGRAVVLQPVTADALTRCSAIHIVDVARGTRRLPMDANERELRPVIESCLAERGVTGLVARVARRREPGRGVVRRFRGLVILQVTRGARRLRGLEGVVGVARLARQPLVSDTKRHRRHRAVIPAHGRPRRGPVALFALRAELQAEAVVLPAHPMAVVTFRRRPLVHVLPVARFARQVTMPSVQRERRRVVELPVRRFELRRCLRRGGQQQQARQADHDERSDRCGRAPHGLWQFSQRGPSAPR